MRVDKSWTIELWYRGGSRISGKGFICLKVWAVRFSDLISFYLNIPWKRNNLVALRTDYFIFIRYLKTGAERGFERTPSRSAKHLEQRVNETVRDSAGAIQALTVQFNGNGQLGCMPIQLSSSISWNNDRKPTPLSLSLSLSLVRMC